LQCRVCIKVRYDTLKKKKNRGRDPITQFIMVVAVKRLFCEQKLVLDEAVLMSRFNHPNIVGIIGVSDEGTDDTMLLM